MKQIVVCGASKNLGKYFSESFSKEFNVFKISRSEIKDKNFLKTDLNNYRNTKIAFSKIKKKTNFIDAIIFCAGNSKKNYKNIATKENFEKSFTWNFYPFVNTLNAYLEIFKMKPVKIIVISSIAGLKNINAPITYSVAKNSLNFYCKYMAKDLARKNIYINIISPGNILMNKNNWHKKLIKDKKGVLGYIDKNVPSNKFINPNEILNVCKMIIENDDNFVGSNIVLDGGQTL